MSLRDEYVASVKSAFVTLGKDAVMKLLIQKVPFLSWGFFNPIASMFVGWVLTQVVDATETGLFFLYIDMRVNTQAKDFEQAAYNNYKTRLNGTPEEIKLAEENLKVAFTKFVRITN